MSHAFTADPSRPTATHWQRWLGVSVMLLALASCASSPPRNALATWRASPNHDQRRPVLIVIHFTDQDSVEESLQTLRTRNAGGPVSAHYLIGADGKRFQLVSDERRAWHAGAGRWGTITDVNAVSIGIELDNNGHTPFALAQIDSLLVLLEDLCTRLRIPRTEIVGHEDIAPARKSDPGPLFPWKRLAEAGFGRWPAADAPPAPLGFDTDTALRLIGYSITDRPAAIRAFRHHFRGLEGTTLDEEDRRILYSLSQPSVH